MRNIIRFSPHSYSWSIILLLLCFHFLYFLGYDDSGKLSIKLHWRRVLLSSMSAFSHIFPSFGIIYYLVNFFKTLLATAILEFVYWIYPWNANMCWIDWFITSLSTRSISISLLRVPILSLKLLLSWSDYLLHRYRTCTALYCRSRRCDFVLRVYTAAGFLVNLTSVTFFPFRAWLGEADLQAVNWFCFF